MTDSRTMFDELIIELANLRTGADELVADVRAGTVKPLPSIGEGTAGEVAATFALRAQTAAAGGVNSAGIQTTVDRLRTLIPDEPVQLFHFSGPTRIYSVFVREADRQIVGVIMVDRLS